MKPSLPLISVCMLTYNHESFIEESIQSVLDQTYENWELIIIDNASTDKTREAIESLIANDERIIFIPQETNLYVSKGVNIAIEVAKGEYIAFFSGDDVYHHKKLEKHIDFMLSEDLELSFTWMQAIDSHSKPSAPDVQKWFNDEGSATKIDILKKYFVMHNVTCAPTAIIKISLLKKVSLFDHRLLQTQDMELWIRLMHMTDKVKILHDPLIYYRVLENGKNLSSNNTLKKKNRTNFEMVQIWEALFTLDNHTLSNIFEKNIDDNNKDFILYEHLKKHNIDTWQYAMLMVIYKKMTEKCDVNSEHFILFFEEYGKFSIMSMQAMEQIEASRLWLEEQLGNHKKTLKEKETSQQWLEEQLESHEKTLIEKEAGISWLENKLKDIENKYIENQNTIAIYQQFLEEIDEKVLKLEEENVWFSQKVHTLEETLKEKENYIAQIYPMTACKNSFRRCTKKVLKKILGKK